MIYCTRRAPAQQYNEEDNLEHCNGDVQPATQCGIKVLHKAKDGESHDADESNGVSIRGRVRWITRNQDLPANLKRIGA